MRMPHNYIVIASLLVMILQSYESARSQSQSTIVDRAIRKFFNDEENLWSEINSSTGAQAANASLTRLLAYFEGNLHVLNFGSVDAVKMINEQLATLIEEIQRTQHTETKWLDEKNYDDSLLHCENILSTIPGEISQIFDITKSPPFMTYLRENSDFCQISRSIAIPGVDDLHLQNVVMEFYVTVAKALVKGYMTSQMAYMVQGVKGTASKHHKKSLELRHSFTSQYHTLETNVRSIIQNFTGEIWNCDVSKDETNSSIISNSYTEITNFVQGYIDNEVNFNREDTCSKQCSDFPRVDFHVCRNNTLCILNYLDKNKTRCDGEIRNCQFIESDMRVCPNQENDQIPNRRYHYIRYYSGLTLGRPQFCPYELKVKSWIRWFYHCSYCFCYCDHASSKYTDRYFSLREATSNIAENQVVTGIQFMKRGRIIHIVISVRKLGPNGQIKVIDYDEATWISDYKFLKEDSGVKEGVDYHELTWKNRIIEIDTIRAPKDEVVTGVRFRVIGDRRLRFEIRTTPFDCETGYLVRDHVKSVWRANNNHDKEELIIEGADVPIRSPVQSKRVRTLNKYIQFTPTDIYKDIAQTTVPFIDTQPVEAQVPKPLIGAGIYYKTTPGYGGFIGPLIILHDD